MLKGLKIDEYVSMAPYTTLKIGGRARFFARATNEEHVIAGVRFAARNRLPLFVLGGGSNVLISDEEFNGLVLQIGLKGTAVTANRENEAELTVAAGEDWDGFVKYCVERGLSGVECLSGIPGSVGGTPVQNVGAYGQEVSGSILSVNVFDREADEVRTLTNAECGFAYRTSVFNTSMRDRFVVLSVTFRFEKGGEPTLVYKDLSDHFAGRRPSLCDVREAVLEIRRAKSMVIDANDPNSRSVGSFFKNPVVGPEKFASIASRFQEVPNFPVDGTSVKIPAAWLIERAGFKKGYMLGGAAISTNHTLALINRSGATASEMIALKDEIQAAVETEFGIVLVPEPVFVGF